MATKAGSVAPKERINIRYVPATGGQQEEIELPLKMLVVGDFTGRQDETPLEDRVSVRIDKDNFDDVMAGADLSLKMDVPACLEDGVEGDSLNVGLAFKGIKDFGPDAIARQVPELNTLLELREALVALKGPMGNIPAFRKQIQALLDDEDARHALSRELDQMLGGTDPL